MMNASIAVVCSNLCRQPYAKKLARVLKLKLVFKDIHDYRLLLVVTESHLALQSTGIKAPGPIYVDFLNGTLSYRRLFGGGHGQLIAQAVGLKSHASPTILDLTAGLGRDAFVLANLGCNVIMLERHPIIAALLKDGLERARVAKWFRALKLKLIEIDAQRYLSDLDKSFNIIYLDPMYPVRKRSSLVKKEMRLLRDVVGSDENAITKLLYAALKKAKHRVVVKRPRLAPLLDGPAPDKTYTGKSSRFDVYFSGFS